MADVRNKTAGPSDRFDVPRPEKLALMAPDNPPTIIRSRTDDVPIVTRDWDRVYRAEGVHGSEEMGRTKSSNLETLIMYLGRGVNELLAPATAMRLTEGDIDVLILGPGVQGIDEANAVCAVFKKPNSICLADGTPANLLDLQVGLREQPPEIRSKVELIHCDLADLSLLKGRKFDVALAVNTFDKSLWSEENKRKLLKRVMSHGLIMLKPTSPEEMDSALGRWADEAFRHLKDNPPGILITRTSNDLGRHETKLYGRHLGELYASPAAIWCRDETVFKSRKA